MPQLEHIKIEGYRSIKSLDLDLRDINVLIGPNAAGKSNFISFFRLLKQLVHENLKVYVQRAGGVETVLYYGQKVTSHLSCSLNLDEHEYLFELIPTEDGRLIFKQERVSPQEEKGTETSQLIGEGHPESNLAFSEGNVWTTAPGPIRAGINGFEVYQFQDTGPSAPPKAGCEPPG